MKKLSEYEEEIIKKYGSIYRQEPGGGFTTIQEDIFADYRQAIKEILEEVVGEDEKVISRFCRETIYRNQAKSEIRANATKVLGE